MDTLPVDLPRQVGLYIRRARTAQGLTRAQLAGLSGVSERSLASIELGDATGVRLDKLLSIYNVLGLSLLTQGENIGKESAAGKSGAAYARTNRSASPYQNGAIKTRKRTTKMSAPAYDSPDVDYNAAFNAFVARNYASVIQEASTLKFTGRK